MMRGMRYFVAIGLLLSLSGCWLALAGAGAEAGYVAAQDDRTALETLADQRITATIKTKLLADPQVSGLNINVDTFKKSVTLKGFVKNDAEADKAVALARSTEGVVGVNPRLVIE